MPGIDPVDPAGEHAQHGFRLFGTRWLSEHLPVYFDNRVQPEHPPGGFGLEQGQDRFYLAAGNADDHLGHGQVS